LADIFRRIHKKNRSATLNRSRSVASTSKAGIPYSPCGRNPVSRTPRRRVSN
jgi:hypothetical protein